MNILILGHKGMLGHMLVKYLTDQNHTIQTINSRFPSEEFKSEVLNFSDDYIINAIGAIPQKTNIFDINYELPVWLDTNVNNKIIHAGTDCEIDDDEYGTSKRKAKEYIVDNGVNTKIIKASIIGPELHSKKSLLEWFLNSNDKVNGYTNAMWSGVTTLEWAKQCNNLINNWDKYNTENIINSTCLSKYDLLLLIKDIFNKNTEVTPINYKVDINKCLTSGNLTSSDIKTQLVELKNYYYNDSI
jgi:dTDP-4-dehydrorhamnose reductase